MCVRLCVCCCLCCYFFIWKLCAPFLLSVWHPPISGTSHRFATAACWLLTSYSRENDEFLSFCTCIRLLNPVEDTNRIEERYLVISTSSILFPTQIIGCFYPRPHTFLIDNFIYIFIIYSYSHAHVSMSLGIITIMTIINTRIHFVFCFLVGHRSVHIQMKTQAKTK